MHSVGSIFSYRIQVPVRRMDDHKKNGGAMMVSDDDDTGEEESGNDNFDEQDTWSVGWYNWPDKLIIAKCYSDAVCLVDDSMVHEMYSYSSCGNLYRTECKDDICAYRRVLRESHDFEPDSRTAVSNNNNDAMKRARQLVINSETVWNGQRSMIEVIIDTVFMFSLLNVDLFSKVDQTKYGSIKSMQLLIGE